MAQDGKSARTTDRQASWRDAWQMFKGALPLLALWLSVPSFLLLLILGLQSIEPVVRPVRLPPVSHTLDFADAGITLAVSIPRQVTADAQLVPSQSVAVMVLAADGQAAGESVLMAVESPAGHLALVDEQDRPFPQPAVWSITVDSPDSPLRFYLHPQPALHAQTTSLQFRVSPGLGDARWSGAQSLPVAVEAGWLTWLFRVTGSQSGVVAFASTLLAALVGFGVQQWTKLEEEGRERRRKREEALAEVASLAILLQEGRFDEAIGCYRELRDRPQTPWREEEVQVRLETEWQKAPPELREWDKIRSLSGDDLKKALSNSAEVDIRAVLWAYTHLRSASREAPAKLKEFLDCVEDVVPVCPTVLSTTVRGLELLRVSDLLGCLKHLSESSRPEIAESARYLSRIIEKQPALQFLPWPGERPPDPPEVVQGVRALGLSGNPFGSERAELDPLLKEYGIRPGRLWNRISGARPVAVFGPSGSGKTALALLLAYDCGEPPANPREEGHFPVYGVFRPGGRDAGGPSVLDWIGRQLTEALLHAVAQKPHVFAALDAASRAACASLWCYSLRCATAKGLALHLRRAGVKEAAVEAMLESLQDVAGNARFDSPPDEATLLDLLGKARPAGYTRTYILVDLEVESGSEWVLPTLDFVQQTLERVISLAARGVYVKLFLPERLRHFLGDDLPVEVVNLGWEKEDLAEMLRARLKFIGLSSLAQANYSGQGEESPDPDGRLIEAAAFSPRQLVRLGNEMLARVKEPPLKPEHLPRG